MMNNRSLKRKNVKKKLRHDRYVRSKNIKKNNPKLKIIKYVSKFKHKTDEHGNLVLGEEKEQEVGSLKFLPAPVLELCGNKKHIVKIKKTLGAFGKNKI